jgi:thiamine biosynthesis lipoprotein
MGSSGRLPSADEVAQARENVGMNLVQLDAEQRTVRFSREGVMLDLGAIGKGYAVERSVEVLRDAGVTSALLHGGTSTVYGFGRPPEAEEWLVAIEGPKTGRSSEGLSKAPEAGSALAMVPLKDEALSVSAVWGKSFHEDGKEYGHVLDPRTGQSVADAVLAAVVLPSATETDAFSTALLTRGAEGHETLAKLRPGMKTLLVAQVGGKLKVEARNIPASGLSRKHLPYFS